MARGRPRRNAHSVTIKLDGPAECGLPILAEFEELSTLRAFRLGLPSAMDQWHVVSDGVGGGAGLYGGGGGEGRQTIFTEEDSHSGGQFEQYSI